MTQQIDEIIEPMTEIQETPRFAYVTFQSLKNVSKKGDSKRVALKRKSIWHFDVSGSHNSPEALTEIEKRGCVCIGSGNLNPRNHREIIPWINARTGAGVHPALRTNPMEEKIALAEKAIKDEAAKTEEVRGKKPKLEVVSEEKR